MSSLKKIEKGFLRRLFLPITFLTYSIYAVLSWLIYAGILVILAAPLLLFYGEDRAEDYMDNITDWFCNRNKLMQAFREFHLEC